MTAFGPDPHEADGVEELRTELRGLRNAMRARATIEQAKGLLMAAHRCDADRAWNLLAEASQNNNVKLRDLATAIVSGVTEAGGATAEGTASLPAAPAPRVSPAVAAAVRSVTSSTGDGQRVETGPADDRQESAAETEPVQGSAFHRTAQAVVEHLQDTAPLALWMVTRVREADQIVVASAGETASDAGPGTALPWLDSFCLHMAAGRAPAVAPRVEDVPLYAAAATGRSAHVRGYAGVPLVREDGELIGTLCGFSTSTDDPSVTSTAETLQLMQTLLTAVATTEHSLDIAARRLQRAHELAETDALTELSNLRGWHVALERETERSHRYAGSAGVISLDLDRLKVVNDGQGHAAGDKLLRATADAVRSVCRPSDVIARTGGDEFAVLVVEADDAAVQALTARIAGTLDSVDIAVSVAGATRLPGESLPDTWARADAAMYDRKRHRHGQRVRT